MRSEILGKSKKGKMGERKSRGWLVLGPGKFDP